MTCAAKSMNEMAKENFATAAKEKASRNAVTKLNEVKNYVKDNFGSNQDPEKIRL